MKITKIAVVCFDKTYEQSAAFMNYALKVYTPITETKLITEENIDTDLSDYQFFFIWNGIDISVVNYENILNNLKPHPYTSKCSSCDNNISGHYAEYRAKRQPCPICGKLSSRDNNFIYIFTGSHLKNHPDEFFVNQLRTRFWTSVDADWSSFRCLAQSVTMIPHIMVMPQKEWKEPEKLTISHFKTPDEPRSCTALDTIKKMCEEKEYIYNEDPSKLHVSHVYIDQLYTGVPSQYAINAMSMGITTMVNLSKFYLSHYPEFPAINLTAETLSEKISDMSESVFKPETMRNYVNKWFNPKRVATQWYHLAKFILDPDIFLDKHPELDLNDIPNYWAFQGGYNI